VPGCSRPGLRVADLPQLRDVDTGSGCRGRGTCRHRVSRFVAARARELAAVLSPAGSGGPAATEEDVIAKNALGATA